jgi:hypothetical protein
MDHMSFLQGLEHLFLPESHWHADRTHDEHGLPGFDVGSGLKKGDLTVSDVRSQTGAFQEDGQDTYGTSTHASFYDWSGQYERNGHYIGLDTRGPNFSEDLKANRSQLTLGEDISAETETLRMGTRGTNHDTEIGLGLSAGEGLGGSLHYGDDDKDGNREYGFDVGIGPVNVSMRSEDPLRGVADALTLGQYSGKRNFTHELTSALGHWIG